MTDFVGRQTELDAALRGIIDGDGVVVTGASGIGKTRLLGEIVERHRDGGGRSVSLHTSPATTSVSLGPFRHLLPAPALDQLPDLAVAVRRHMVDLASGGPVLVVIDDAHELDTASIGMLSQLIAAPPFAVAAAVRAGARNPDGLDQLWHSSDAVRVELGPLRTEDGAALIDLVVGGRCEPGVARALTDAAGGNALLLRELVLDAKEQGVLHHERGSWILDPGIGGVLDAAGDRTELCVRRRIGRLDPDEARLLQIAVVAGALRPDVVPEDLRPSLERLETRSLVSVVSDGRRRWTIGLDHPVIGEVVRRTMPASVRAQILRQLLDAVRSQRERATGDERRIALWAEEVGDDLTVDEWLAASAAATASFDREAAARWAARAVALDPRCHRAHRSLGRLQRLRGDVDEAAESFRAAGRHAVDDEEVVGAAIDLAGLVALTLRSPGQAIDGLLATVDRVNDAAHALALRSEAAVLATLVGRFDDVLVSLPGELDVDSADDATRWLLGLNEVYARTMLGRVEETDRLVERTRRCFPAVAGERPQELDFLLGLQGAARLQRGELRLAAAELRATWDERRLAGEYRGISAVVLALVERELGHVNARAAADDACDQHRSLDPLGTAPVAFAVASLVAADHGDLAAAERDAGHARSVGSEPWRMIWAERALASVDHHRGDDASAARRCAAAAEAALDASYFAYAAITAHDLVGYGDAGAGADLLDAALVATEGGGFLEALRRHAHAAVEGSPGSLHRSAVDFARMGATRLAAAAHRGEARAAMVRDDPTRARWADARARLGSARRTGSSSTDDEPAVDDPLTARELEIAARAGRGAPSRVIATDLGLSVRTVDNHLRSVYAKLRVAGRSDLAALASTPAHRGPDGV